LFAAKIPLDPDLASLVNTVRASQWSSTLDEYWGKTLNDDDLAQPFAETSRNLEKALAEDDYSLQDAAACIEQATSWQACLESLQVGSLLPAGPG
jgi:hypothetical protein